MVKHGVGSREFKKIIKDIEKECSSKKRTICMHCGSEQGKIILDKPSTFKEKKENKGCLLYTSPSPRDATLSRMPSSA